MKTAVPAREDKRISKRYETPRIHRCGDCRELYTCDLCSDAFAETANADHISLYPQNIVCAMRCGCKRRKP